MQEGGLSQQLQGYLQFYWGGIVEGTAGPAYAGIIILVLALFSLFVIKKEHSIWIISLFTFTVLLSYGKYLIQLTLIGPLTNQRGKDF